MLGVESRYKAVKHKASGIVTERDLVAISWVVSQGVMTVDQLFRAIYSRDKASTSRHAYRRIQFLEDGGYLTSVYSTHKQERFLKATKKTQQLLGIRSVPDVSRSLHIPTLAEIPHAEILTEIRIAIARTGKHCEGIWWRSEGSLLEDDSFPSARFRDLMPDALWITKSGKRVAIEFERTRKGITRIRKKVEGLDQELNRGDRAFDLILWVSIDGAYRDLKNAIGARNTQILRTIAEFLRELKE